MADETVKPDQIPWPGFQDLADHLGIIERAATDIAANDGAAAGNDQYGKVYQDTRGTAVEDVLALIKAVQGRTFVTGEAGHTSAVMLDQAELENRGHAATFTPEHQ